jgi:hypothetical protein
MGWAAAQSWLEGWAAAPPCLRNEQGAEQHPQNDTWRVLLRVSFSLLQLTFIGQSHPPIAEVGEQRLAVVSVAGRGCARRGCAAAVGKGVLWGQTVCALGVLCFDGVLPALFCGGRESAGGALYAPL